MSIPLIPPASEEALLDIPEGFCALSYHPLDVEKIIASVQDCSFGATAVFIGTTRNYFKGKVVTRLEYQAYSKLAIKTMANVIRAAHDTTSRSVNQTAICPVPPLLRCAVYHRLGTVPTGEPSIVIAVSSPHRKEAFMACEEILEQIKLKAQIWKKEYYEGEDEGEAEWKANAHASA